MLCLNGYGSSFAFAIMLVALPVLAQSSADKKKVANDLQCTQFRKSPDGSWKAMAEATLGAEKVGGKVFKPGGSKADAEVVAALNKKCVF